ncbi:MAG: recombination protein NinB [Aeromonadaceae bacterium]
MKIKAIKTSGGLSPASLPDVDAFDKLADGEVYAIEIKPIDARSTDQNAMLWALLTELSIAKRWHGRRLSPASWKTLITASMDEAITVPSINGSQLVVIGKSTSHMTKAQLSNVIEMCHYLLQEL